MNKKEVKRYTLCCESTVIKTFGSIEEKQNYIKHELNIINNDKRLDYYYLISKDDKGKDSTELELSKLSKISESSTLKHLDDRTFETYKSDPLFNSNGKVVITYKSNGEVRTLSLAAIDSKDYFDEDFLSDRINSLICSGEMRVSAITCIRCIAESRDLEKTTEEMTRIQGNYDEKKSDLSGMHSAIIDFVKALNFNEQYRRFRDVALFVYRKDAKLKEQEVAQSKTQPAEIEPIVVPEPIDKIGDFVLPKPMQTSFLGEDRAMVLYTKAGIQAKKQDS